jgi:short-subunit dehydrogenase
MQLKNARILLTGATGGLGQELARQLADAGAALLLAGRDSKSWLP